MQTVYGNAPRRSKAEEMLHRDFEVGSRAQGRLHRQYERRLLQYVVSVRRVGATDRRDHQEVRAAEARAGSRLCITTMANFYNF